MSDQALVSIATRGPRPTCPTCYIQSGSGKRWSPLIKHPATAVYVQFCSRGAWFCTPDHARVWMEHFYSLNLIGKWKRMEKVRRELNAP